MFLSGEDCENFLFDSSAQAQFEQMVFDAGFVDLEVFIRRPAVDYFQFIYSELSKHDVWVCPLSAPLQWFWPDGLRLPLRNRIFCD